MLDSEYPGPFDRHELDACEDCGLSAADLPPKTLCDCHCPDCGAYPRLSCQCEQLALTAVEAERAEFERSRSICEAVEAAGKSYLEAAIDLLGEDDNVSKAQFEAALRALGFDPIRKGSFVEPGERAA